LPLDLTTETTTISVPPNSPGTGVTNPSGTFCGACDLDDTQGCQSDTDCINVGDCSGGVGSGCCVFGTNVGFAANTCPVPATSISVSGARGTFIPHLAGLSCMGKSGDALVDATAGLPGPTRYVEPRFNVFAW
jgi:hypothetical protein